VTAGLIDSTEMYLRTVLELEEEGVPALRARLAERLGLSAPSVSEGVSRLVKDGHVELAADRTVQLTAAGRLRATHVLRKHRLAERLLADVLGLEPEHVHEEACRWEHVISDRVEDKLVAFLGNPGTSPYGNPIPGADVERVALVPVADAHGPTVRLERVSEHLQTNVAFMQALGGRSFGLGAVVALEHDDGLVVLRSDEARLELDRDDARLLFVTEA
jgi:DtxR family Mn-dependent transcriptional regulator